MEWSAKATVITVKSEIGCDSSEFTLMCGVFVAATLFKVMSSILCKKNLFTVKSEIV